VKEYRIYQVDSFTRQPFQGNPAGVVPDARGLSDEAMQSIAREMNKSETAFIFPGEDAASDVRVRFFTPTAEVPICGHATIAAHYILAHEGVPFGTRHQHTAAGILAVDSEEVDGGIRIWMHQQPGEFSAPFEGDVLSEMLTALGLEADEMDDRSPVQIVSTGHSKVVIPVRSRATIAKLAPDMNALAHLSARIGCNGYYTCTMDSPDAGNLSHGRMFAPAIGIAEDPVTGNASGCLGAYLVHHGLLPTDENGVVCFYAGQGEEVGRPGRVLVEARQAAPGEKVGIRIAGEAVITLSGTMVAA
jgi:PhzF family phenazine biosynthesis protein